MTEIHYPGATSSILDDRGQITREWQDFFSALAAWETDDITGDWVAKSGSITQIATRKHADLQDLDALDHVHANLQSLGANDHPQYLLVADYVLPVYPVYPVYAGSGVFNGSTGVSITIGLTLSGTAYHVSIQPTGAAPIDVGVISVVSKSTLAFTVTNSGSDTTSTFDWILVDKN